MSIFAKARLAVAGVIGVLGLVFVVAAMEGSNPVTGMLHDGPGYGSFGDRGGTVGVVLLCTAVVLGFMRNEDKG